MQQAEAVILAGVATIAAYEVHFRRSNQLISHGFDRLLIKHPILGRVIIGVTALHLANALDGPHLKWVDPYKWVGKKW